MTTQNLRTEIIGFDSGWGCDDYGCEDGPSAVAAEEVLHALAARGIQAKWRGSLGLKHLGDRALHTAKEQTLPILLECLRRLGSHVRQAIENNQIPIVIGGDHSSAIGTWSGAVSATQSHGKFGLIWLDAHMDSHTYATSSEGKWGGWWHGQPIPSLLGRGLPVLRAICDGSVKLAPEHISLIGMHSFEPAEVAFAKKYGIRVYFLEEVEARGFRAVFAEALERATTGTKGFGLSVDLDCFHVDDAPGVGTAENAGLRAAEVLPIIRGIALHPAFRALEIAEFNPHNDQNEKTRKLLELLIATAFTKD